MLMFGRSLDVCAARRCLPKHHVESDVRGLVCRRREVYEEHPIPYLMPCNYKTVPVNPLQETSELRSEHSPDVEWSTDRMYITPAMICWTILQLHSQI
jgi:hypothetical protein